MGHPVLIVLRTYLCVLGDPMAEHGEDPHGGDGTRDGTLAPRRVAKQLRLLGRTVRRVAGPGRRHRESHGRVRGARPKKFSTSHYRVTRY